MNVEAIRNRLAPVFERHPEVGFAYLFGSAALERTDRRPRDIDIAVWAEVGGGDRVGWLADLHGNLTAALETNEVDLVHLNGTDNIMLLDEIVRRGVLLWEPDSVERRLFEARIWHQGIDFKEKRKRLMGV